MKALSVFCVWLKCEICGQSTAPLTEAARTFDGFTCADRKACARRGEGHALRMRQAMQRADREHGRQWLRQQVGARQW